jgi:hypothetical protein
MRLQTIVTIILCFNIAGLTAQKKPVQKTEPSETKYFIFQSNPQLNAHLFLYNKAMGCKFKKVTSDSLAYYAFKDKLKAITPADILVLNELVLFYKDSLLSKDLLFDSLMRDFSDKLIKPDPSLVKWQKNAREKLKIFMPYFTKMYWVGIEKENNTWLAANRKNIERLETIIVPELERIYETKLPNAKVIIDLTSYASWAGAYSFNDSFSHVIFSSSNASNKDDMGLEVVFHETSHFLVDKLNAEIATASKGGDIKKTINLWHNIIFYTTGAVMTKHYSAEGRPFIPYYVHMKFEDKFPDFKTSVQACRSYWDSHIEQKTTLQTAVNQVVTEVLK